MDQIQDGIPAVDIIFITSHACVRGRQVYFLKAEFSGLMTGPNFGTSNTEIPL